MDNPFENLSAPPANSEVLALRHQVADLRNQLATQAARQTATTGEGLVNLVANLLPQNLRETVEIMADEDMDGDLTLTLSGVRIDEYGNLAGKEIEFEVEANITVPVTFTIRATDQDEAHDLAHELLRDAADDVNIGSVSHENLDSDLDTGFAEVEIYGIMER